MRQMKNRPLLHFDFVYPSYCCRETSPQQFDISVNEKKLVIFSPFLGEKR